MIKAWDLPKTHFPTCDGWILVRDGLDLPSIGDEILFVRDIRGTQNGEYHRLMNFDPKELRKVMRGFVSEVGYSDALQEHWIEVTMHHNSKYPVVIGHSDEITYWRYFPELPEDNYVPREQHPFEQYQIVVETEKELENASRENNQEQSTV